MSTYRQMLKFAANIFQQTGVQTRLGDHAPLCAVGSVRTRVVTLDICDCRRSHAGKLASFSSALVSSVTRPTDLILTGQRKGVRPAALRQILMC
jgi:hypothetical protein